MEALLGTRVKLVARPEHKSLVRAIYDGYGALLASNSGSGSPSNVTLTTAYTFGPLRHWSFGLGAGAVFHPNWNQPVKLSGTTLVDDPLNGVMTSVNAYADLPFLGGYDETTLTPQASEVFRWVIGAVITPEPGGFVGLSIHLPWPDFRSLSINGGYAVMLATVPTDDGQVGQPGTTKRGGLGAWVVQLGYSF